MTPVRADLDFSPALMRDITVQLNKIGGLNLGQGFCLLDQPPEVLEGARQAIADGRNVCPPIDGIPELRRLVLHKLRSFNRISLDANNLLVTAGATGAFESICPLLKNGADPDRKDRNGKNAFAYAASYRIVQEIKRCRL